MDGVRAAAGLAYVHGADGAVDQGRDGRRGVAGVVRVLGLRVGRGGQPAGRRAGEHPARGDGAQDGQLHQAGQAAVPAVVHAPHDAGQRDDRQERARQPHQVGQPYEGRLRHLLQRPSGSRHAVAGVRHLHREVHVRLGAQAVAGGGVHSGLAADRLHLQPQHQGRPHGRQLLAHVLDRVLAADLPGPLRHHARHPPALQPGLHRPSARPTGTLHQ